MNPTLNTPSTTDFPSRVFKVSMPIGMKEKFEYAAQRRNLHSREFLRGLVTLFALKTIKYPGRLQTNKILTCNKRWKKANGKQFIFAFSPSVAHDLYKLAIALNLDEELAVANIIEFVVNAEQRRGFAA